MSQAHFALIMKKKSHFKASEEWPHFLLSSHISKEENHENFQTEAVKCNPN